MFFYTDAALSLLHKDPIAVELVLGLQEVSAVGPKSCNRVRHHSCTGTSRETGDEFTPVIVGRHILAL